MDWFSTYAASDIGLVTGLALLGLLAARQAFYQPTSGGWRLICWTTLLVISGITFAALGNDSVAWPSCGTVLSLLTVGAVWDPHR